jgi:hypothetical protein
MCVMVGCVGDEPTTAPRADSGPLPVEASTIDAGVVDSGSDAVTLTDASDAAPPACDVSKPFGRPAAVLTNDVTPLPLTVYHFRVAKNATRAYYLAVGTVGLIEADLTADRKVIPGTPGLALTVLGIGISEDETRLVIAPGGPAVTLYTRASASAPFVDNDASKIAYKFLPPTVPNATVNDVYNPYLKKDGGIMFALNQRDSTGAILAVWDVYEGTLAGTTITAFPVQGSQLPAVGFNASPVPSTDLRMFLTRWGTNSSEFFGRLYEARRTIATGPWNAPTRVALTDFSALDYDAGPPPSGESMTTFDVSPDQCELFFGKGDAYRPGTYQVFHARRPL